MNPPKKAAPGGSGNPGSKEMCVCDEPPNESVCSAVCQALYEWDPGEDPEEQDNESILDAELYEPRSKVASLQALFAMMQYTKRKFVDPTDFICKLGLNPSVQQDAQE